MLAEHHQLRERFRGLFAHKADELEGKLTYRYRAVAITCGGHERGNCGSARGHDHLRGRLHLPELPNPFVEIDLSWFESQAPVRVETALHPTTEEPLGLDRELANDCLASRTAPERQHRDFIGRRKLRGHKVQTEAPGDRLLKGLNRQQRSAAEYDLGPQVDLF